MVVEKAVDVVDPRKWSIRVRDLASGAEMIASSTMSCLRASSVRKFLVRGRTSRGVQVGARRELLSQSEDSLPGEGDRVGSSSAGTAAALLPEVGDLVEALGRWGDWRLCEVETSDSIDGAWAARIVTLEGEKLVALIDANNSDSWRLSVVKKCLVRGCKNRSDQGIFRGSTCYPCANFLAGRGDRSNSSQAYRNHVAFARETFLTVSGAAFDQLVDPRKL